MKTVILDSAGLYQRDARDDEPGALVVSGPNVFSGYLREEHDRTLWVDLRDGRRWLNTGDLARRDADGYFWLTGRTKELIIRGGHNIDPAVIEQPLYSHAAVQLAAAVGRPDAHAGEVPVAYVQLRAQHQATEDDLLAYLRERITERAAMPKSIIVIGEMPLTSVGKIFKPELKRRQIEHAVRQALQAVDLEVESLRVDTGTAGHGTSIEVTLIHEDMEPVARQTLANFSFSFRIVGSA